MLNDVLCLSTGTLSSIPTALTRWTDECKVLDAESMHDCVAGRLDSKALVFLQGMQDVFSQPDDNCAHLKVKKKKLDLTKFTCPTIQNECQEINNKRKTKNSSVSGNAHIFTFFF